MWVFLPDAFLSIVADRGDPSRLLVRARCQGDIERVFPEAQVLTNVGTDYRYRASLPREVVARAVADRVTDIRYPNLKDTVRDQDRHDAYLATWEAMRLLQKQEELALR